MECAALVPATFLLAPLMVYGILGMAIALLSVSVKPWGMTAAVPMLRLIGQMLVGCVSLACLWLLLLRGVDAVKRIPRRRWLSISVLLLGLADGVQFLLSDPKVTRELVSSTASILIWVSLLALPMLVGIRYLVLLLIPVPVRS